MKKATRKAAPPIPATLKTNANKSGSPKSGGPKKKANASKTSAPITPPPALPAPETGAPETGAPGTGAPRTGAEVLDRLHAVIIARRMADPAHSHSARLLARGPAKVAQKFGEEAVECLIEAVAGDAVALVAESADVLYHLLVMWVAAGVAPNQVWAELQRREGVSGVAEKAARLKPALGTRKIP